MNQTFRCGDQEALISYLYDECQQDERRAVTAHLATCASCAGDIAALSGVREQMSSWTPPRVSLGFRMTDDRPSAAAWWQRPLPAWAQLAAAAMIFATGLGVGVWVDLTAATDTVGVSAQAEITRLEQRLRDLETQQREQQPVSAADHAAAHSEILQVVNQELQMVNRDLIRRDAEWTRRWFEAVNASAKDTEIMVGTVQGRQAAGAQNVGVGFARIANTD